MSPVEDALRRTTEPRFTRDVDCAVSVEGDGDAERVVAALLRRGYRAAAQVEQESTRRLATMRLAGPSDPSAIVDLLFASSGLEVEIVRDAESLEVVAGKRCKVARVGHLIAMKLLARDDDLRPLDRSDLIALMMVATREELERARSAVALIVQRGFARGRNDLAGELETAIRSWWKP